MTRVNGSIGIGLLLAVGLLVGLAASQNSTKSKGSTGATPQKASDPDKTPGTVEGVLRDVACPLQNHKSTATDFNLECAEQCVKNGAPLGILTRDGTLYLIISDWMSEAHVEERRRLVPLVGKYVRASGDLLERNGNRGIELKNIDAIPALH